MAEISSLNGLQGDSNGGKMNDKERYLAEFAQEGADAVREKLATGRYNDFKGRLAAHWLGEFDRAEASVVAEAARRQADAAESANSIAERALAKASTANTIAGMAMVIAAIATAVASVTLYLQWK